MNLKIAAISLVCALLLISCDYKPSVIVDAPLVQVVDEPNFYFSPYFDGNKRPLYEVAYVSEAPSLELEKVFVAHIV